MIGELLDRTAASVANKNLFMSHEGELRQLNEHEWDIPISYS